MAKVYVSSTFLDLKDCRARVNLALRKMGHTDVAMEYYVAGAERPVERCLADVADCDLYVGLFAWRYGYVPSEGNLVGLSITEMEYRQAQKLNKPCLIFLLSEDAPWPRTLMDKDATRIERLRTEFGTRHMVGTFTSSEDIGEAVYPAVYKWSEEHGHLPRRVMIPELDLTAYVSALTRRYQHLDLDALTPPQRDENLRQRLREIFVEQNVRENPPPVELPKEVWEKLQRDREIHPEDLPSGVTPEDVFRARESYFEKPSRPVLEALTDPRHQRSIVLGDPGSGKSTLSRYVLLSLITGEGDERLRRAFEGHLPLLIELRSYAGLCSEIKGSTFLDFVEFLSKNEGWGLDKAALEHYLKTDGRAVVVFDGLDEIFDPDDREQIARRIAGFANLYTKAHVLVTSRVIGYRRKILTDAGFSHFTLQDLDERQVEQFIDRWYALALDKRPDEAKARRERIMRSFKDSPSIRQLAGNPMLLTIMAIIGKNQELPRERWKLYDHAAGVLIYHWDVERHLRDRRINAPFIGEEEKKELLRRLAFKMQSGEGGLAGNYIHRDDLQREFESYLRERFAQPPADATTIARAMIEQFRERNFILSLYGANLYGFVHRAFLEFFCATAFVQKFEKTQELTLEDLKRDVYGAHWNEQTWHEVLRLICGMVDEKFAGEFIDYLAHEVSPPPEALPWNVALAVQCLAEARTLSTIEPVAIKLLQPCFQLFERVGENYVISRGETELEKFLDAVLAPSAKSIGRNWSGKDLIITWLRRMLYGDCKVIAGYSQNHALGIFAGSVCSDHPQLRPLLIDLMHYDNIGVQCFVAHTLLEYRHRHRENFELLRRSVREMSHGVARAFAAAYLADLWPLEPEVHPLLLELLSKDGDGYVRGVALATLGKHFREDRQTLLLLRECAVKDDQVEARQKAVESLAKYFSDDVETLPLVRRAVDDTSNYVRRVALSVLANYFRNNPLTLPLLTDKAINDASSFVRSGVVSELSERFRESPDVLPLLHERAVNDVSPEKDAYEYPTIYVRSAAILAIARYWPSHPSTLPLLRERAQNDPATWLRKKAEELVNELERKGKG